MWLFGPNIDKLRAARDIDELIKLLDHGRPGIRAEAARALGQIADPRTLSPLVVFMNPGASNFDQDSEARAAIREALPRIATVERLLEIFQTGTAAARSGAVMALGLLGDRKAVEPLIAVLGDSKAELQQRAIALHSLMRFGDARAAAPVVKFFIDRLRSIDTKGCNPDRVVVEVVLDLQFAVELASVVSFGAEAADYLRAALHEQPDIYDDMEEAVQYNLKFVRVAIERALHRITPE